MDNLVLSQVLDSDAGTRTEAAPSLRYLVMAPVGTSMSIVPMASDTQPDHSQELFACPLRVLTEVSPCEAVRTVTKEIDPFNQAH